MEWDTLVAVGFGSLLTFLVTELNRRSERADALRDRRRDLLIEVQTTVTRVQRTGLPSGVYDALPHVEKGVRPVEQIDTEALADAMTNLDLVSSRLPPGKLRDDCRSMGKALHDATRLKDRNQSAGIDLWSRAMYLGNDIIGEGGRQIAKLDTPTNWRATLGKNPQDRET